MTTPEAQAFTELVRQRYFEIQPEERTYSMFCPGCGYDTQHVYLNDQGIYERYQCTAPGCGMIRSVAVR